MSNFIVYNFAASREKCFKQIEAAIAKYQEIKENINEGLKFYVTLQVWIIDYFLTCPNELLVHGRK